MQNTTGSLIRKFRLRSGLSQFELENKIGAAFGSISRIELNKVDPSKETINKIVEVLNLSTHEAALLYALDINYYSSLTRSINHIHSQKTLNEMLSAAVDSMSEEKHLIGTAIFIIENNFLQFKTFGNGWYVKKIAELLGERLHKLGFPVDADYSNAFLKCIHNNEVVIVDRLFDCIGPVIDKRMCNFIQKMVRINVIGIAPISRNNESPIGAIAFSYSSGDTVREVLPIIVSYADAIGTAMEKFEK